jgi:hypothetical protein
MTNIRKNRADRELSTISGEEIAADLVILVMTSALSQQQNCILMGERSLADKRAMMAK